MNRQSPEWLLIKLTQYVFMEYPTPELRKECMDGLTEQLNRISTNELYRVSKTARTQEEREAALNKWYDAKDISEVYRVTQKKEK